VEYRGFVFSSAYCGPWNESPGNCKAFAVNSDFMDPFWISEPSAEETSAVSL